MSGTRSQKRKREYQEYENSYPACVCCGLRMTYELMEGHIDTDHSPKEMRDTLIQFAHEKFRKDRVRRFK